MYSLFSELECSGCGEKYSSHEIHTYCPACQSPLLARYRIDEARAQINRTEVSKRPRGMWRWHELLPVKNEGNVVFLGEGDAPLLRAPNLERELGLDNLYIKDESANPNGNVNARGFSAAVSRAKELGIKKVVVPTIGSAGGAVAAYAARAGLEVLIYMPDDTPPAIVDECRLAGAEVVLVDGLINDSGGLPGTDAREEGWFDLSAFKEPYRLEGRKATGFELAEAFNWKLPDVIIYPIGSGLGLVGLWKAFSELGQLGWLDDKNRPRMIAVQPEGCAPLVRAYETGAAFCNFWMNAHTIASGMSVPKSFADVLLLRNLRASGGKAVAVTDAAMLEAKRLMGKFEGMVASLEGAATLAALKILIEKNWVSRDEHIVLFNTGSKYVG